QPGPPPTTSPSDPPAPPVSDARTVSTVVSVGCAPETVSHWRLPYGVTEGKSRTSSVKSVFENGPSYQPLMARSTVGPCRMAPVAGSRTTELLLKYRS